MDGRGLPIVAVAVVKFGVTYSLSPGNALSAAAFSGGAGKSGASPSLGVSRPRMFPGGGGSKFNARGLFEG